MTLTDVLTSLLVVITGYYAWITHRILRANEAIVATAREQSEAISRPYMQVSLKVRANHPTFELYITNIGHTAARQVKLTLDDDFVHFGKRNLREFNAFSQVIETFAPREEITFFLGSAHEMFSGIHDPAISPHMFGLTVVYFYGTRKILERVVIDIRPYLNANLPSDFIGQELKELRNELKQIRETVQRAANTLPGRK